MRGLKLMICGACLLPLEGINLVVFLVRRFIEEGSVSALLRHSESHFRLVKEYASTQGGGVILVCAVGLVFVGGAMMKWNLRKLADERKQYARSLRQQYGTDPSPDAPTGDK